MRCQSAAGCLGADLKHRAGRLSYAGNGVRFELDDSALEATADGAVVEGAGNTVSIPAPRPAPCHLPAAVLPGS